MHQPALVFVCLAALVLTACSSGDGSEMRDASIDSMQLVSIDTFPPSYKVHVVAQIPGSSCHRPQPPTVSRNGRTFRISVLNFFTGDEMCTADLGYRDLAIEHCNADTWTGEALVRRCALRWHH